MAQSIGLVRCHDKDIARKGEPGDRLPQHAEEDVAEVAAIDGDLGEWAAIPNAVEVNRKEQVIWGTGGWDSVEDMHGTIQLAWRQEYLFIGTRVIDDQLCQSQRGANIWKGDHVEVYIDAQPDLEPNRQSYGEGQFQFIFSPGNFLRTGDSLSDCPISDLLMIFPRCFNLLAFFSTALRS